MIIYARCWTSHTDGDSVYYYRTRIRYDTTLHTTFEKLLYTESARSATKMLTISGHMLVLKNSVRRTVFTCAQKLMPASLIYQN